MKQREITDRDGTAWTCVQAYAGLGDDAAADEAAERLSRQADGKATVAVVCTPRGGEQSVRIELVPDWVEQVPDDRLREAIDAARQAGRSGDEGARPCAR